MKIIVDANIIFSALIKESTTRELILKYDGQFLIPNYVFIEINKYKEEILRKSNMTTKDFNDLFSLIIERINVVPSEVFKMHVKEAQNLVGEHSPEDIVYISCALAFSDCILWSNDKKLKWQNKVKVFNTKEMIVILN